MYIITSTGKPEADASGHIVVTLGSVDELNIIGEIRKAPIVKYLNNGYWCYECIVDGVIYRYESEDEPDEYNVDYGDLGDC